MTPLTALNHRPCKNQGLSDDHDYHDYHDNHDHHDDYDDFLIFWPPQEHKITEWPKKQISTLKVVEEKRRHWKEI